jgi:hypothetical protein
MFALFREAGFDPDPHFSEKHDPEPLLSKKFKGFEA